MSDYIELPDFTEDQIFSILFDKSCLQHALLSKIFEAHKKLFGEMEGYEEESFINSKHDNNKTIIELLSMNQALLRKIASLYLREFCEDKTDYDRVKKEFYEEVKYVIQTLSHRLSMIILKKGWGIIKLRFSREKEITEMNYEIGK